VSDFEIVAGVFVTVFILGIGVGIVFIIAMSALRRRRGDRSGYYSPRWTRREKVDLGREEQGPDDDPPHPQWPRDGGFPG
jgi:hypothetical protein